MKGRSERRFWTWLQQHVFCPRNQIYAVRVENAIAGPGTPDICWTASGRTGWIELKVIEWPRRANTIVRLPGFRPQQRVWLRRWQRAGGIAHLLLWEGKQALLFDGVLAAEQLGKLTRLEMEAAALVAIRSPGDAIALRHALLETEVKG